MGTPQLKRELAEEAVRRVEDELRSGCVPRGMGGGKSAVIAAGEKAVKDGFVNTMGGFESRLRGARDLYQLEPDDTLFRARQYHSRPPGLPVIPSQDHITEDEPEGEPLRVAVIGDAHDSPHLKGEAITFTGWEAA